MRVPQPAIHGQRFEIMRPLGSGGFGAVYEARDNQSGQRVALKELTRVSPSTLFRFKHEFRALADIHHHHLVRLRELIELDGRWYIVMELVEGSDLLAFVRPSENDPGFDEARLRTAFIGIADGLEALHGHGILHRDLKPSNVVVTPEGRAVLLDFGLATSVDSRGQSTHAAGVGTVLYMAPEQADGQKLGRATDWYAFGASLYEALTGQPPFDGESALQVALDKLKNPPRHPSTLVSGLPPDLSELCMALLQIAPQSRPRGREVLQVLRREATRESLPSPPVYSLSPARIFAGRESELEHLERALLRTHEGELRIVLVEGESGVGKSELVAEFLRRQEQLHPNTLALRGRCYENEQVSYKAFDGCIDELARHLRRMGRDAATLMPLQAPLLAQLFPVLADIQPLMQGRSQNMAGDPTARRLQAFGALAGLLSNLAEERPVILVIDDLQWADAESFRLLRALVESQTRPPVLILATVRPREQLEADVSVSLAAVRDWRCTDLVSIFGLPKAQAEALAHSLLGTQGAAWASTIAVESRGHPLFLAELVHFTQSSDLHTRGNLTLEAALEARVERLDRDARAVLEMVALAARPHAAQVFARALELPRIEATLSELLRAKLLRTRRDQEVGCYHDRIRRTVTDLIPSTRLPLLHKRLAQALAANPAIDPSEEAAHWDLAGDAERALDAYIRAAKHAFEALAFNHAERLFARALELCQSPSHPVYASLSAERANALACAGRSAQAATLYQTAAELATSEEQRLRLRSRTAMQLMLSGKLQRGMDASRALFAELGVRIPKRDWAAVAIAVWHGLRTRFRKDGRLRERRDDKRTSLLLELLQEQIHTLGSVRTSAYLAAHAQYARLALLHGEPVHASLAYASRGWLLNARKGITVAADVFAVARKLCALAAGDYQLQATLASTEGSARLASFQWSEGTALLERAQDLLQTHSVGEPWSLTYVRHQLGMAWFRMGEHAHLAEKMDAWVQEAQERKDHLGTALLTGMGHGVVRHLMRGSADAAQRELDESMAPLLGEPFSFAHFGQLIATRYVLGLKGGRASWDWFLLHKKEHDDAFLLKTRFGSEALVLMRSHAALEACTVAQGTEREALLRFAERSSLRLQHRDSVFSRSMASLVAAQVATLRGRTDDAVQLARSARSGFEGIGDGTAAIAGYLEGLLEGGESGKARCDAVLLFYASQGWVNPEHAVLIRLPAAHAHAQKAQPSPRSAQIIAKHYAVIGSLGSGGFGTVVEARDLRSGEHVALKQLVSKSGRALARFKQEFRVLRDLNHPNLVRLSALFEEDSHCYIAMELVRGQSLLSYVRPHGKLDSARLRRAFTGLLSALRTLHEAGLVHRDISSDNVCVSDDGRAVLIDFGLAAREHSPHDAEPVGNPGYAPPEQLEGVPPHRSADAYALGACLYQALTGKLPLDVGIANAATVKRSQAPALPREVPAELSGLAALAMRLLAEEPAARPSLRELDTLLAGAPPAAAALPRRASLALVAAEADAVTFKGRQAELARLHEAKAQSRAGFTMVLVEGESGLGKSALVSEFARMLTAEAAQLWCLEGRCYENEQLAFKAFDGIVDALAKHLRTLPSLDCEELLPKKAALLAQLFPVLGSVRAIADAPKKGLPADPAARRTMALSVFIDFLERLARSRPLFLMIDDLQWADAESLSLLHALSARAEALPILLVATVRPLAEVPSALRASLAQVKALPSARSLPLCSLDAHDTRALAETLLGADMSDEVFARLARESQGHPLFLRELAELAKEHGTDLQQNPLTLDEAFAARLQRFSADARALLAVVALAGKPYARHVFNAALQRSDSEQRADTDELLNQGLLRRRGDTGLGCFHDRIRQVAVAALSSAERSTLSGKLAQALDTHEPHEAAERARLWDEAGNASSALAAHEQAGDAALHKLAFAQAAQHYARALALAGDERDERWQRLTIQRAHALSRAGRTGEAATLYSSAAAVATADAKVRLRVLEAQHLLRSAQVKEGMAAASSLLAELGQPLPASDGAALRSIMWDRLCVRVVGQQRRALGAANGNEAERELLQAIQELDEPIQWVSFLGGASLTTNHLRRSLRRGEPRFLARALAAEGLFRASQRRDDWAQCFAQSRELLQGSEEPETAAYIHYMHGASHLRCTNFDEAIDALGMAHKLAEEHCQGQRWLLTRIRANLGTLLWWQAQHQRFATLMHGWIEEAQSQGDKFALMALCSLGCGSLRFLISDEPDKAFSELASVMEPWPKEPFSWGQWGALYCTFATHLYMGGRAGYDWYQAHREVLKRQVIVKAGFSHPMVTDHHARLALAAIEDARSASGEQLLRECVPLARKAAQHPAAGFRSGGFDLLSMISALRGDRESALAHARSAKAAFDNTRHGDAWKRAEYLLASLEGGRAGRERQDVVHDAYNAEGWRNPQRALAMYLPRLQLIERG